MQFYNEFELLEIKLEELWDVVDFFVISESTTTHTGIEKPLNLAENMGRFDKYKEKIIYQTISNLRSENTESKFDIPNSRHDAVVAEINRIAPWDTCTSYYSRDIYEKESLIVPLLDRCKNSDIIILGDCDEIPNANILKNLVNNFDQEQIYHLAHDSYWYYFNLKKQDEKWYGNIVLSYENYLKNSFCNMRQHKAGVFVQNAGWHFSYMPVSRIKNKMKAITHQDLMTEKVKSEVDHSVNDAITLNRDIYGRPAKFEKVSINHLSHPKYLVDNLEKYVEFIL